MRDAAVSRGLETFTVVMFHETHAQHADRGAVLVSETGELANAVWIPKGPIDDMRKLGRTVAAVMRDGSCRQMPVIEIVVPEWLAIEKGLA